jgi:hypothetical protein
MITTIDYHRPSLRRNFVKRSVIMDHKQGGVEETKNTTQPTREALQEGTLRKSAEEREPISASRELKNLTDRLIIIAGAVLWGLSGLALVGFQIYWFYHWWGNLGVLAGFLLASLSVAFPFLYLFKEGFSLLYFGIWLAGMVGIVGLFVGSRMFQPDPAPPPRNSMNYPM